MKNRLKGAEAPLTLADLAGLNGSLEEYPVICAILGEISANKEEVAQIETEINFETQATTAFNIGQNEEEDLIDTDTGKKIRRLAKKFSLMKFGELTSVQFYANEIVKKALENEIFIDFLKSAGSEEKTVYITSPGVYNVPSASNLLLKEVATRLNVALTQSDLPTVIVAEQTRLGQSSLDYSSKSVKDRGKSKSSRSIAPEKFRDQYVIFVDDVFISGTVANRALNRFHNDVGVAKSHYLFGIKVDPKTVEKTDGIIEDILNRAVIDGTLKGILPVVTGEFTPVQKTLRDILKPENIDDLPEFFTKLSSEALLKIYAAASNNDFRRRYKGLYKPGIKVLQEALFERGLVDVKGKLTVASEIISTTNPEKISVLEIDSRDEVSPANAEEYSRMKYGDPEAIKSMARKMFDRLLESKQISSWLETEKTICFMSSAFGSVPTAATALTIEIENLFREAGINIESIKVDRHGDFSNTQYGDMSPTERAIRMKERKIVLSEESKEKLSGKVLLVVDDLNVTGSHEKTLDALISTTDVKDHAFTYMIDFSDNLAFTEPHTEEFLNRYYVRIVLDLLSFFKETGEKPLAINARLLKFVLSTTPSNEADPSEEEMIEYLDTFLAEVQPSILLRIHEAAMSSDGYQHMPKFKRGFRMLETFLIENKILSLDEVNKLHGRSAVCQLTVNEEGKFVDFETGEDRQDLAHDYSLMKFGGDKEIKLFGSMIADKFISDLRGNKDGLFDKFKSIGDKNEFVSMFVPGSRNVESSSNFVLQDAVEKINVYLALNSFPTIIVVNLVRLESNTANYATLSEEERATRPPSTKTMLPGKEFYLNPMHVIFGDDVRITGTTADRAVDSARDNGAQSCIELYGIVIDPTVAFNRPSVEQEINDVAIAGELDENVQYVLNQEGFRPVQRIVRLVLSENNRESLYDFLQKISNDSLVKLYIATTSNDYMKSDLYRESAFILKDVLVEKNLINSDGLLV